MKTSTASHTTTLTTIILVLAGCPSDDISEAQETSGGTETTSTSPTTSTTPTTSPGETTNGTTHGTTDTTASDSDGTTTGVDTTGVDTTDGTAASSEDSSTGGGGSSSTGSEGTDETATSGTTMGVAVCGDGMPTGDEECDDANQDATDGCLPTCQLARSCAQILQQVPGAVDGTYTITPDNGDPFAVSCDMTTDGGGWTLTARFSTADNVDHWMLDDGGWWFDLEAEQGNPVSTSHMEDMISEAFWRVPAQEFKIARTDNADPSHLLMTNDDCLDGDTFRGFITSLGFENVGPWATDEVLHTCAVDLGNNYADTAGFVRAECSGDIGAPDSISFWANWHDPNNAIAADSAVMMIGGGGQDCGRADHGIGITEENDASFAVFDQTEGTFEADFGNDGFAAPPTDYALNLYVR